MKLNELTIPLKSREPFKLPKLVINDEFWNHDRDISTVEGLNYWIDNLEPHDFFLNDYESHGVIKAPLSN